MNITDQSQASLVELKKQCWRLTLPAASTLATTRTDPLQVPGRGEYSSNSTHPQIVHNMK